MQILSLCKLHLVAASSSYTCAQDGLDTVQLALVVFFLPSTSTNTPLALMLVIVHCNLRWWCFPWSITNVHTNKYIQIATCTVWWYIYSKYTYNKGNTPAAQVAAGDDQHECKRSCIWQTVVYHSIIIRDLLYGCLVLLGTHWSKEALATGRLAVHA